MKKVLVFLLAALLLCGCSSKKSSGEAASSTENTTVPVSNATLAPEWEWLLDEPTGPVATVATLELNEESLSESLEFYFLMNSGDGDAAYLDALKEVRSFSIDSFSQSGDVVTAEISVTMPDVYGILKSMDLSAYTTAEETDAAISSAIHAATSQTKQISLQFTAGVNRWEPVMDEVSADAFYGGLLTFLSETLEGDV